MSTPADSNRYSGGILILAAGSSRRFGSDKRRAVLADGSTLMQASLRSAVQSGLPCLLCLSQRDRVAMPPALPGVDVHFAAGTERGMGATLASGIRSVPAWTFVLVALGDMPWILPSTFTTIAKCARSDRIIVPHYKGRSGHPVAFGADFFSPLSHLDGDSGGRSVIDAHPDSTIKLPIEDPGILADVDRASDVSDRIP